LLLLSKRLTRKCNGKLNRIYQLCNIAKDLDIYNNLSKEKVPFKEKFEAIYEKAKENDVKVSTAKKFVSNLSQDELKTVKIYASLANDIHVNALSDEGAYNLLVHMYEKYDFNNDGFVADGEARGLTLLPKQMDDEAKRTWVKAMNSMDSDKGALMVISFGFNMEAINRNMAQHMNQMSDSQLNKLQENATYDIRAWINETLSQPYHPKTITFLDIMNKVDGIINGNGDTVYASPEFMKSTKHLKIALQKAHEEVLGQMKQEKLTTLKKIDLENKVTKIINRKKDEPTAEAIDAINKMVS